MLWVYRNQEDARGRTSRGGCVRIRFGCVSGKAHRTDGGILLAAASLYWGSDRQATRQHEIQVHKSLCLITKEQIGACLLAKGA